LSAQYMSIPFGQIKNHSLNLSIPAFILYQHLFIISAFESIPFAKQLHF